jgi:ribose 5-phosphate isomerase RpiB
LALVDAWLETPFEGERHERRLSKIAALEGQEYSNVR